MVESLGRLYGTPLCEVDLASGCTRPPASVRRRPPAARGAATGKEADWVTLYALPSAAELAAQATEEVLREHRYGYRSKYIIQSMKQIVAARRTPTAAPTGGASDAVRQHAVAAQEPFYRDLLAMDAASAQREALLQLQGVGRKVADCVLLFGLERTDVVPVDTHMAQLAAVYLEPSSAASRAAAPARQQGGVKDTGRRGAGGKRMRSQTPAAATAQNWQSIIALWKEKQREAVHKKTRRADGEVREKAPVPPPLASIHHDAIQEGFRVLFGDHCGWAHSILFYYHMTRKL
ncbi:N-glycosylase/DNA lyase [Strigomonas culicis]|nr:N-glycosylase/DNA lyase [Strigomonas culicis]|eukprot:EPY23516.1 N-glycosylase/DNA lyase [Strigomonas culicis]